MKSSIQIGKIMDIPIKLHVTFLLILPVFAWMFANEASFGLNEIKPDSLRYVLSTSAAILLFVCVLLHELGHSYVAKKHGAHIQGITLFLFGGVSSMEEIPRNPRIEFKMALAGPSVSLLIGLILIIIWWFFEAGGSPYLHLIWIVGYINLVLFVFNLLPAFPMDGGRVLRAWLASQMPYIKATHAAAGIGKMFAILMGVLGLVGLGPWFILIAFFIYIGASEEEKSTEVSLILEGVKIKDIMSKEIKSVNSGISIEELVDIMFKFKHMGYPVVDEGGLKGIVTFTDVQRIPKEERKNVKVSDVMTKEIVALKEEDDASIALRQMTAKNIGRIIIKDDYNKMTGIVSRTDLLRAVELLE
ncbi:MAG: CBS domain-containing protein [Candidatus Methanoperedens sp.]|nr:CBS domain-containing protein [Candidatus Methanoperedens sp.]